MNTELKKLLEKRKTSKKLNKSDLSNYLNLTEEYLSENRIDNFTVKYIYEFPVRESGQILSNLFIQPDLGMKKFMEIIRTQEYANNDKNSTVNRLVLIWCTLVKKDSGNSEVAKNILEELLRFSRKSKYTIGITAQQRMIEVLSDEKSLQCKLPSRDMLKEEVFADARETFYGLINSDKHSDASRLEFETWIYYWLFDKSEYDKWKFVFPNVNSEQVVGEIKAADNSSKDDEAEAIIINDEVSEGKTELKISWQKGLEAVREEIIRIEDENNILIKEKERLLKENEMLFADSVRLKEILSSKNKKNKELITKLEDSTRIAENNKVLLGDANQLIKAIKKVDEKASDQLLNRLRSKLKHDYDDLQEAKLEEMSVEIGEIVRDQLIRIYRVLEEEGIKFN